MTAKGTLARGGGGLLALVACAAVMLAGPGCDRRSDTDDIAPARQTLSVARLTEEIEALEFINRLQLEGDQPLELLQALSELSMFHNEADLKRQAVLDQMARLLQQKRGALLNDQPVPREVSSQLIEFEGELAELSSIDPAAEARIAKRLREVLSDAQVRIAAGGLEARIEATHLLDGFRDLRSEDFENEVRAFSEELGQAGSDPTPDQIEALLREARSLSGDEYTHSKEDLVRQLEPLFIPAGATADWLLVRGFLSPRLLPILEEKAGAFAGPAQ